MKLNLTAKLSLGVLSCLASLTAVQAWDIEGFVRCPNQTIFQGVVISVSGTSCDGPFSSSGETDGNGQYAISLPECPGTYTAIIDLSTLPADATLVSPGTVDFAITDQAIQAFVDWTVDSSVCGQGLCWFTGGGMKIDNLLNIPVAEKGLKQSFGGNVYPGCSPTAGDGGNWNHIARDLKLHFQGRSIQEVNCGNVTPPPGPGSNSPKTPFNFLECQGTGTLKGVMGNKADYGTVTFFARFEDRNEPGHKGPNDGALIDRYYLRVTDSSGVVRLLINSNTSSDPADMDPAPITAGNFQIHVSSCDNPPNF